MSTEEVNVTVIFNLKKGKLAKWLAAVKKCVIATNMEDGCITYNIYEDLRNPLRYVMIEKWQSKKHLDAHSKTAHFKAFFAVADVYAGKPAIYALKAAACKL